MTVDSTVRDELVHARDAVWRAYYEGDTTALRALLPDPMVGMGEDRATIISQAVEYARGRRLLSLEFTCDEFYHAGDVGIIFSNYHVQYELNGTRGEDRGRAIEVFEHRNGTWVNPSWHLDSQ